MHPPLTRRPLLAAAAKIIARVSEAGICRIGWAEGREAARVEFGHALWCCWPATLCLGCKAPATHVLVVDTRLLYTILLQLTLDLFTIS